MRHTETPLSPRMAKAGYEPASPKRKLKRNHMLRPKPTEADRTEYFPVLSAWTAPLILGSFGTSEQRVLTQIVETADLVDVNQEPFLLVPVDDRMIDILAAYLTDIEDNEPDHEDEIEQDGDALEDHEPNYEDDGLNVEFGDKSQDWAS